MSDKITYKQYAALSYLVAYGNLYQLLTLEYSAKIEKTHEWWRSQDPTKGGPHIGMVHNDPARWLIEMGYARTAEHDPLFARAKIVPTQDGRVRLEHHGLMAESEGVGTHIGHCCKDHGCKYGDRFCPVASGMFEQDDSCESCYEQDRHWDEEREYIPEDRLVQELESRGYTVIGEDEVQRVWRLSSGDLDMDGDGWKPGTPFSGRGAGGTVGLFHTRAALVAYVERHPPCIDNGGAGPDYKADAWTEDPGSSERHPKWYTGPTAQDGRHRWLTGCEMRIKGDEDDDDADG